MQTIDDMVWHVAYAESIKALINNSRFRNEKLLLSSNKPFIEKYFIQTRSFKKKKVALLKSIRNESFESFLSPHLSIMKILN